MPFQKGNKLTPKYRDRVPNNGGPNPNWLKHECNKYITKYGLIQFLGRVATGEKVRRIYGDGDSCIMAEAEIKDRLKAVDMLIDRAYGKAPQAIEHDVKEGRRMVFLLDGKD